MRSATECSLTNRERSAIRPPPLQIEMKQRAIGLYLFLRSRVPVVVMDFEDEKGTHVTPGPLAPFGGLGLVTTLSQRTR